MCSRGGGALWLVRSRAFTLVELAVVLVVIGLISAAVISGQSLIRNATFGRVIQDIRKYQTAVTLFKEQYGWIPGDIPNASTYWSTAANGDGNLDWEWRYDGVYAWQHMTSAGLLNFPNLSGNANGGQNSSTIPEVSYFYMSGAGYHFVSNFLGFGQFKIADRYSGAVFSSKEMAALDAKYDDGHPSRGFLRSDYAWVAGVWAYTSCVNTFPSPTAYLALDTRGCFLSTAPLFK